MLTVTRPGLTRDLPPGLEDLAWVANCSTLIHGARDAVLVDTFLTMDQSRTLVDWVAVNGKELITIHVTHGTGIIFSVWLHCWNAFRQHAPSPRQR